MSWLHQHLTTTCSACNGTGVVRWLERLFPQFTDGTRQATCEACGGSGRMTFVKEEKFGSTLEEAPWITPR